MASTDTYVASSPGRKNKPIPDGLLVRIQGPSRKKITVLTFEYKSPNAMPEDMFVDFQDIGIRSSGSNYAPALRFWWPTAASTNDKATKILTQVWCQLVKHNVHYVILSSYQATIFFYRDPDFPGRLHFSPTYKVKSPQSLILSFAWMASALGLLSDANVGLIAVDDTFTNELERPYLHASGIDARAFEKSLKRLDDPMTEESGTESEHISSSSDAEDESHEDDVQVVIGLRNLFIGQGPHKTAGETSNEEILKTPRRPVALEEAECDTPTAGLAAKKLTQSKTRKQTTRTTKPHTMKTRGQRSRSTSGSWSQGEEGA
ncbi:hypothetical protein SCP_1203310 [Sparassis crispa]|uniref:Uncharacterized protein n=1 Tax=Sparassis crispa TaxID=139825 RepID=A0A401H124_9APHY|nr:hypothetical protein SCP_1203310 [Sparassis crispa]GBE88102.1 hypothetical protein SCP_1203310 [Sparassis crispa]